MKLHRHNRAFTLIEILVVVSIVAVVMSIAVLSLGVLGDDRDLREEGRRLIALVQVAQDEAVMQGREFGIEFMTSGFRFVEFDPLLNTWSELIGDDTLRMRELPEEMELDLWVEGQHVLLETEPARTEPADETTTVRIAEKYAPHILVFSSGDMTPFELRVQRQDLDQLIVLESNLLGDIKFQDPDDR